MAPGVGGLVAGPYLVDCPCTLSHAVATGVVEGLHDVQSAHAHPNSLVSWLLLHQHVHTVVYLRNRLLDDYNRITAYVSS